ncbi:primosomal protein DnaI [Streptococcus ovis]|uniref:primosomal protein DnaI n=1 Tax=Streptococcus ovis TaxID=82806 RepID=UPI00036DCF24|nr:primosomal protein DnaI [Streptococcus ovis]
MKDIQDNLKRQIASQRSYQELCQEILSDTDISDFISENQLTEEKISLSISRFFEYIKERDKFLSQDSTYIAKGYKPILIMNEGYADVSYEETAELIENNRQEAIKKRLNLIELPTSLKNATLVPNRPDSVHLTKARTEVLSLVSDFIGNIGSYNNKGFYLYGDFGVGKSFILAALAHDLSEKYSLATTMIHYPSFAVNIKNAIATSSVKEKIDEVKKAPILILDDIGAEQHSSWVRDDVLQVILQYRMQENLPTFFTSNFSLDDLEKHFSSGKSGDETWQAKRVMERIRFLAKEIHLVGDNRRHRP